MGLQDWNGSLRGTRVVLAKGADYTDDTDFDRVHSFEGLTAKEEFEIVADIGPGIQPRLIGIRNEAGNMDFDTAENFMFKF
jgi:hypothetical protein